MEASKFKIEDGQDAIRLEVESRINHIMESEETEDVPDNPVDEPLTTADYQALEASRLNEYLASPKKARTSRSKWERDKVRVFIDGKHVWKPRAECVKQPRDNSNGGSLWKWVWVGPQDKQSQIDAMWEAHGNS